MLIKINRTHINRLYTMGALCINGIKDTDIVEATQAMLPVGQYIVRIVKRSARKQDICIFDRHGKATGWILAVGHSWINSRHHHAIIIGTQLVPGVIYRGAPVYERITDRLMKAHLRKEDVELIITEKDASHGEPISLWLDPSNHTIR